MPSVYIITNYTNTVLYTGVTNDLERRMQEHRLWIGSEFAKRYRCCKLVYYDVTDGMYEAIAEEKRIKAGSRASKIILIERRNPEWADLSEKWPI